MANVLVAIFCCQNANIPHSTFELKPMPTQQYPPEFRLCNDDIPKLPSRKNEPFNLLGTKRAVRLRLYTKVFLKGHFLF